MRFKFILLICWLPLILARVPPRNHETEGLASEDSSKPDIPVETLVERSPIDTSPDEQPSIHDKPSNRKPISVILFRQQPALSLFSNRSPNPFALQPSLFDHSHFHTGNLHDDPALRLISLLFGRQRPIQPESPVEAVNASESSAESEEDSRRDVSPIDSLFPHLFPFPRFPIDEESEKEGEASTSTEEKTPANFENKEKKVINIGGRKFVKTTQVKKVKNDFGQFHSVISSYQPFDESIHDENGDEKVKPNSDKVDKKDVETSTAVTEKVNSSTDGSSSTTAAPEREDRTTNKVDSWTGAYREPEKLKKPFESLSKEQDESKNEIPDKNVEIKVDQMN